MRTEIDRDKIYWASFNRFEMRLSGDCVLDCSHSGDCENDVLRHIESVKKQIESDNFRNKPTPEKIRTELAEYGAWDKDELQDDDKNFIRLVWIAACNISEDESPDCSEPIKN